MRFVSYISLILYLFSFALSATESDFYKCFKQQNFQFCVPTISKGTNLITFTKNENNITTIDVELKQLLGLRTPAKLVTLIDPQSGAETQLIRDNPNSKLVRLNGYFPEFINKNFNRFLDFSGPNCYNTALITLGVLGEQDVRYVNLPEFRQYLRFYFDKVFGKSKSGDVVLYSVDQEDDHAAYYLFNGLVFHKKGVSKKMGYRIVDVERVMEKEPFEPVENSRSDDFPPDSNGRALISLKKNFYRIKTNLPKFPEPLDYEKKQIEIIDYIHKWVVDSAPKWSVGKNMGVVSENTLYVLKGEFKNLEISANPLANIAYEKLVSLYWQINLSIEESHYTSPFSSQEKVNEQICVIYNEYLNGFIERLLRLYGRNLQKRDEIIEKIKGFDRKKCDIPLLELVKNI